MGREGITRGMLDRACEQINKALKCPITYSSEIELRLYKELRQDILTMPQRLRQENF